MSSPRIGSKGIVPNFCRARSEEERRRRTTGCWSSCWREGEGWAQGHLGAVPTYPALSFSFPSPGL